MRSASRLGASLVTVALALRIWDALLFEQLRAAPLTFVGWMVLLCCGVQVVALTARRDPGARWRVVAALSRVDAKSLAAATALLLALLTVFHWSYLDVQSDGRNYFVQARSFVLDRDAVLDEEIVRFGGDEHATYYGVGTAVLWSPFLAAAHVHTGLASAMGRDVARTGFETPYRRAVGVATVVYGFIALVLMMRLLCRYFPARLAVAAVLLVCCGSFVIWYLVVESSMSHGVSLFAATLFVYWWHERARHGGARDQVVLGAAAALMITVRWANVAFLLLPLADLLGTTWRGRHAGKRKEIREAARRTGAFAFGAALASVPQMWFWLSISGKPIDLPTDRFALDLGSPHFLDVLFSPNHGLFTWSPLLYLAVLGLVLFVRAEPRLGALLGGVLVTQIYINGMVVVYWGGSGYGARRFTAAAVIFACGLAAIIQWLVRRPVATLAGVAAAVLTLNFTMMAAVASGRLPSGETVTFARMIETVPHWLGNPFAFPSNAMQAWRYGIPARRIDELAGRAFFNVVADIGTEAGDRFLGHGWASPEREVGRTFRWAMARQATLLLPLREPADYVLQFDAAPYAPADGEPQQVRVEINGQELATFDMSPAWDRYRLEVPAGSLRATLNEVRFRFRSADRPAVVERTPDARSLAARFDEVRFERGPL